MMKFTLRILCIVLCIGCIYILFKQLIKTNRIDSSVIRTPQPSATILPSQDAQPAEVYGSQTDSHTLQGVVEEALRDATGIYGIAIKNLKSGETFYMNEHGVFNPASLYKLWIMATVYKQIQNGKLREDQIVSEDVATLNDKFDIASDSAERKEGTVTFTIRDAIVKMITISDNYAALLLSAKVRLSSVAALLKEQGLRESTVGTSGGLPTATPYDIALFLEKLYNGELANRQYTDAMVNVLKSQQLSGGIPKYLPDTSKVANKTGEIDGFKHDAGIIFLDNGDYIVVIMSESNDPLEAQERIALVSKGVFDYFAGK